MARFFQIIDPEWLSARLGQRVSRLILDEGDVEKLNRANSLRFASATLEDGSVLPLVLKVASESPVSKQYGLAREALFYENWASLPTAVSDASSSSSSPLALVLPKVYYAEGSMDTGDKLIVMEDVSKSHVQLGYYYGPGNPNNNGKDLAALTSELPLDVASATRLAFSAASKLHAPFWGCRMEQSWLTKAGWISGRNEEEWKKSQDDVASAWANVKAKIAKADPSYLVSWDPFLVSCIDASIDKAQSGGWSAFQAELRERPFTMVHGDFHPANVLVGKDSMLLVDWEAVGLGSGPQELGQFMISHATPALRAAIEKDAVAAYYAELKTLNPQISMTLEECMAEYVFGGLGRWLFFLPLNDIWFAHDPAAIQFFADQALAFIKDHGVTPENVPMPRV